MHHISIAVSIFPTEDEDKIRNAILNLFPDANITKEGSMLNAIAPNMNYFIQRMREQQIQDSARRILFDYVKDDCIIFYLIKQAAFVGKVNYTEGDSILGDLMVIIKTDAEMPNVLIQKMTGVI